METFLFFGFQTFFYQKLFNIKKMLLNRLRKKQILNWAKLCMKYDLISSILSGKAINLWDYINCILKFWQDRLYSNVLIETLAHRLREVQSRWIWWLTLGLSHLEYNNYFIQRKGLSHMSHSMNFWPTFVSTLKNFLPLITLQSTHPAPLTHFSNRNPPNKKQSIVVKKCSKNRKSIQSFTSGFRKHNSA